MNPTRIAQIIGLALLGTATPVSTQEPAGHSAVNPAPRADDWWKERAEKLSRSITETQDSQLIFIGDSITQGWEGVGAKVWEERYTPLKAVNLGIGGDRTQHVLWRLDNGNLEGIHPKAAVIMIGTNNSNGIDNTAGQIIDGVTAIVQRLRTALPETKVLLLGIFPRGENMNEQRGKLLQINQVLAKLDDGDHVHFLDIGYRFVTAQGLIPQDIMPDFLHLTDKGYRIWADAIDSKLGELIGENEAAEESPINGNWTFTIRGPNDEDVDMPMELKVEGDALTGRIGRGGDGWLSIDNGKVASDTVSFSVTRDRPEGGNMVYQLKGSFVEGKLTGSVSTTFDGAEVVRDWRARRPEAP
ncbi:MAG: GDSL-type esterase/lipase family protein [Verrucomicrobia bacterium]|nr:GDSL-type esterase/lipase family protein [Verrucomicrobiota bacterium]